MEQEVYATSETYRVELGEKIRRRVWYTRVDAKPEQIRIFLEFGISLRTCAIIRNYDIWKAIILAIAFSIRKTRSTLADVPSEGM